MKPPAFQFYADDFLGGTITMSHAERGLYIQLLCLQWTQGHVTKQDVELLANGTPTVRVLAKFHGTDDHLCNARMEAERQKQAEYRQEKQKAGKIGAEKRWHSHGTAIAHPMANGMANGMAEGMANDSSPSPSPSPSANLRPNVMDAARPVRAKFEKPSIEAVKLEAAKIGLPESEAERFVNYYESNGWRVGRNPMRSWAHALINWRKNYDDKRTGQQRVDRNIGTLNEGGAAKYRGLGKVSSLPDLPGLNP